MNISTNMKRVEGKVAIITGAGRGIGAAIARLFAQEGAIVLITDVTLTSLQSVASSINAAGGNAQYLLHDVSSEKDWITVTEKAMHTWGRIDILVNNAGITGNLETSFEARTVEEFNKVIAVNLTGQFLGMKTVQAHMQAGASIVNVSSIAGITGNAGGNAYTASKGGSRMLSKGAAIELAKKQIRVNSVHPGYTETPMVKDMQGADAFREMALGATPLGRGSSPEEIAQSILFLASDEASFITGSELIIDGGFTAF